MHGTINNFNQKQKEITYKLQKPMSLGVHISPLAKTPHTTSTSDTPNKAVTDLDDDTPP